ncbi:MAG: hypothetical protein JSW42_15005 [Chloroflexota bacterium]|nr:MAG: hypothetical protein JSW42_15005 [Chloroflexota bacterium]
MKKISIGVLVAVLLLSGLSTATAFAADGQAISTSTNVGPYEGVFSGVLYGDNNSSAPIALQMTHRNGVVSGRVYLGEGLYVNAGMCGKTKIPSMVQSASGRTLSSNPNKLVVNTSFNVSGFDVGVDLTSTVSADGKTLNAGTKIDLPWICGRDPSYSGTLYRIQ